MDRRWREGLERLRARVDATGMAVREGFPHYGDVATGSWTTSPAGDWTGGFWCGMCWLAALGGGEPRHRRWALEWAERLRPRAGSDTVFRGFLFYYGALLGAVLLGDAPARELGLAGAKGLAGSFNPSAGVFPLGNEAEEASDVGRGESSIDGVQGMALLVWAARETGETSWREMAVRHTRRHVEFCVRPDGSVCQSASFEPATGKTLRRYTHKGIHDASTWARAQAWGILGYTVMHQWTGEPDFLDVARRTADWWLAHLPGDRIAPWDFDDPAGAGATRDTSATAIVAASLLKLAALAPDGERRNIYRAAAEASVEALLERYLDQRGILSHGCYNKRIDLATQHELIWGSYYLFEALHVLTGALDATRI
ncbi:MAG: glycoside hydrolase family 88 protein [Candidatus Rokubacteria bacterium]|nr:glycoside hydrolase family 88 protein [Candidatus Rokubacteria bacterium]